MTVGKDSVQYKKNAKKALLLGNSHFVFIGKIVIN